MVEGDEHFPVNPVQRRRRQRRGRGFWSSGRDRRGSRRRECGSWMSRGHRIWAAGQGEGQENKRQGQKQPGGVTEQPASRASCCFRRRQNPTTKAVRTKLRSRRERIIDQYNERDAEAPDQRQRPGSFLPGPPLCGRWVRQSACPPTITGSPGVPGHRTTGRVGERPTRATDPRVTCPFVHRVCSKTPVECSKSGRESGGFRVKPPPYQGGGDNEATRTASDRVTAPV